MEKVSPKVLECICNHKFPEENLLPQKFVNSVSKTLQQKDNQCLYQAGKNRHCQSTFCNERLYVLSAVQACFEWRIDKRVISPQSHVVPNNLPKSPGQNEAPNQNGGQNEEQASNWFIQTKQLLLADDNILLELLSLQDRTKCLFTLHLVKKIILLCSMRHEKISKVLKYIEKKWRINKIINASELELVKLLISKRQSGGNDEVRGNICSWFLVETSNSLHPLIINKLKEPGDESLQEKLLVLSILGKILKTIISSNQDIPLGISNVVLSIMESYEDMFFASEDYKNKNGHLVFLHFLKLLNNCIHMKFFFEKVNISETVLQICTMILQSCTFLFEMSKAKSYLKVATFWEGKDLNNVKNNRNINLSIHYNFVVVREIFFLIVKASAILIKGDQTLKGCSIYSVCNVFEDAEALMTQCVGCEDMNSGLIALLFGDQDDKWIAVLLCLLYIYQYLTDSGTDSQSCIVEENKKCPVAVKVSDAETYGLKFDSSSHHQASGFAASNVSKSSGYPDTLQNLMNPHKLFFQLAEFICFDHLVISDFLISPETCFLEYFIQYLLHLKKNWDSFVDFCCSHEKEIQHSKSHKRQSKYHFDYCKTNKNQARNIFHKDPNEKTTVYCCKNLKRESSISYDKKMTLSVKSFKQDRSFGALVPYADSDCSDSDSSSRSNLSHSEKDYEHDEYKGQHVTENFCTESYHTNAAMGTAHSELGREDDEGLLPSYDQELSLSAFHEKDVSLSANNFHSNQYSASSSNSDCPVDMAGIVNNNNSSETETVQDTGDCNVKDKLDKIMTMLIRLRFYIERLDCHQLIPFKADTLIKLLMSCEEKYENIV